jgi:hypothetical protein
MTNAPAREVTITNKDGKTIARRAVAEAQSDGDAAYTVWKALKAGLTLPHCVANGEDTIDTVECGKYVLAF